MTGLPLVPDELEWPRAVHLAELGVGIGLRTRSGMMNGVGDLSSSLNASRFDVGTGVRTTLGWREMDSNCRFLKEADGV